MNIPALDDTIVAVATGWEPAPLGIVRLSGPASFALVAQLGAIMPGQCPHWSPAELEILAGTRLHALVYWFRAPRSYTGQNVVEVHTAGSLPLLRELCRQLIAAGARRALPGEFTARAFINGRLDAAQVADVLALMRAQDQASLQTAARHARGQTQAAIAQTAEQLVDLLARVEAGIDFVEEEDVRFISAAETVAQIDELMARLRAAQSAAPTRHETPHIALAGLPNAGKSTLFNALLGYERALVSPVLGTTRDVLSAELLLDGRAVVLQDAAGLGAAPDELELATHLAAEEAMAQADVVLWVHAADQGWQPRETSVCERLAGERRVLVRSKVDLGAPAPADPPLPFAAEVAVSALREEGLSALREIINQRLATVGTAEPGGSDVDAALGALERARALAAEGGPNLAAPELVALELRAAHEVLAEIGAPPVDEQLLGRIFAEFCVGK